MLDEQADQVTIRCIHPFTGRKPGQEWVASGPFAASWIASGHAVRADEWAARRSAALVTAHLKLEAGDHDGRMAGEAFVDVVINDPKVQACGEWLCLECPVFRKVFTEGLFPSAGGLHDRVWPVVLDPETLIGIFGGEVSTGGSWGTIITVLDAANSGPVDQAVDPAGPVYHAAKAIADQHKAFFDLLRVRQLVADGVYKNTGARRSIDETLWSRPDKRLDCDTSDLIEKKADDVGAGRVLSEGMRLKLLKTAEAVRLLKPIASDVVDEELVDSRNRIAAAGVSTNVVSLGRRRSGRSATIGKRPSAKPRGKPGRREAYDWEALEEPLEKLVKSDGHFESLAELVNWCIEHVKLKKNARRPKGDGVAVKTAKAAIIKYGLDKLGLPPLA
jgi:hypothetical protein